ncbi:CCKAR [Mytilus coruscus]|uniref:CCKAR n=1 Tax=Mytilus coruscus TaxID=42192 RepID=A0A6J8DP88_MYTCO|nr:CCKAR [Mytilus coruscus]
MSNWSRTIDILNKEETTRRIPVMVYISIVFVIGTVGNMLVIIVYFGSLRKLKGAHWTFIRAIAVTDALACILIIPYEFYQQTHQLTFYSEWTCKCFRTTSVHIIVTSCLLLVIMSVNRLYQVCWPMKAQLSPRQAYVSVFILEMIAALLALPQAVNSGINLVQLENNITGYDCSFATTSKDKKQATIYSGVLFLGFLVCISALITIYGLIGHILRKRDTFKSKRMSVYRVTRSVVSVTTHESTELGDGTSESENDMGEVNNSTTQYKTTSCKKQGSRKLTKIAFSISLCFVLSYLPSLVVTLTSVISKDQTVTNNWTPAVIPILSRLFLINNIINVWLYYWLDNTFRSKVKKLSSKLLI